MQPAVCNPPSATRPLLANFFVILVALLISPACPAVTEDALLAPLAAWQFTRGPLDAQDRFSPSHGTAVATIRLAPTVVQNRVLFGADDGTVYCLAGDSGELLWKDDADSGSWLPGNGRMIHSQPVRSGVLVEGKIAYFTRGLFPAQGVELVALDIETGKRLAFPLSPRLSGPGGRQTVRDHGTQPHRGPARRTCRTRQRSSTRALPPATPSGSLRRPRG